MLLNGIILKGYCWEAICEKQIDSISANITEGFGRYSKKDKIKFYRYSLGSLYESLDWNEKSQFRSLLSQEDYFSSLMSLLNSPKHLIA